MLKKKMKVVLALLLAMVLLLPFAGGSPVAAQGTHPFPQTGYSITRDAIWNYFQGRGGVDTFGYPVSNTFLLQGFQVQIMQRNVLQVSGDVARPLNLLDPSLLPVTKMNGSTFPAYDAAVAASAPGPGTPNYGDAVRVHIDNTVPNSWNGQSVGFRNYYYSAAPADSPSLNVLIALEVWGFPTSAPARDPNNHNFVYQRFQRGIMHYDATLNVTRGILLGDAFKSVLTGQNLPADLEADLAGSPFLRLYDPRMPNSMSGSFPNHQPPVTPANTDLTGAFNNTTPPTVSEVEVMLVSLDDGGPIGCGDSLVGVRRPITPTTDHPLSAAIQALLEIGGPTYGESGLYNALYQSDLEIDRVTLVNGTAEIRLEGEFLIGGVCDEPRVPAQIEGTARQFSEVQNVVIYINGEILE